MNLNVGAIDDLELVCVPRLGTCFEHTPEHASVRPSEMESIDTVGFAIFFWQLVPLSSSNKYPPDTTQSFEKIGWFPTSFLKC